MKEMTSMINLYFSPVLTPREWKYVKLEIMIAVLGVMQLL